MRAASNPQQLTGPWDTARRVLRSPLTNCVSVLTLVRGRVDEIRQAAAISTAAEIAFDQQRVLNRLDVLSHKAEDLGQISVAVRCEELIGKHRGMFIDRQVAEVAIFSEPSIALRS